MKKYIGTKVINAAPMNRQDYNDFRGWKLPDDENGADEGYLVEYIDGGKANTSQYEGYVSWSPKDVFERAYKQAETPLDRMKIESDELQNKIHKLQTFLERDDKEDIAGAGQVSLMKRQLFYMEDYLQILLFRINKYKLQNINEANKWHKKK